MVAVFVPVENILLKHCRSPPSRGVWDISNTNPLPACYAKMGKSPLVTSRPALTVIPGKWQTRREKIALRLAK